MAGQQRWFDKQVNDRDPGKVNAIRQAIVSFLTALPCRNSCLCYELTLNEQT